MLNPDWFKAEIASWHPGLSWSTQEVAAAASMLAEIAAMYGGEIVWDARQDDELARQHAINCARLALQARMTRYWRDMEESAPLEKYGVPSKEFTIDLPLLAPSKRQPKVDLNSASLPELEALPGLGKVSARAIFQYRLDNGGIADLDEAKKIAGIDEQAFKELVRFAIVLDKPARTGLTTDSLQAFLRAPTFSAFVKGAVEGAVKIRTASPITYSGNPGVQLVLAELKATSAGLLADRETPRRKIGQRATAVAAQEKLQKAASALVRAGVRAPAAGLLLRGSQYRDFVVDLISQAKNSVSLAMFFLQLTDDPKYPTRPMVDALVDARKRGVDVRVVLDRDKEGDPYGSRLINKNAFEYLKAGKVSVRFDSPNRALHAKTLVVDAKCVIVGSHNWTAGSIFQYSERSAAIRSDELAGLYQAQFDKLWASLAPR